MTDQSAVAEQYRARGKDAATTATDLGVTVAQVEQWWADQDAINAEPVAVPQPRAHGNVAGYNRHYRHRQRPCMACRIAYADYQRRMYAIRKSAGALRPCGTHAAFNRHRATGQEPCAACVTAERAYQQERHVRRRQQREAAA